MGGRKYVVVHRQANRLVQGNWSIGNRHYEDEVDEEVERCLPHRPPPVELSVVGGEHLVSIAVASVIIVGTAWKV